MTATIKPQDVEFVWVDYYGSDWVGIYVHGDKVYEGHPPDSDDVFRLIYGADPVTSVIESADLTDKRRMRGLPQTRRTS